MFVLRICQACNKCNLYKALRVSRSVSRCPSPQTRRRAPDFIGRSHKTRPHRDVSFLHTISNNKCACVWILQLLKCRFRAACDGFTQLLVDHPNVLRRLQLGIARYRCRDSTAPLTRRVRFVYDARGRLGSTTSLHSCRPRFKIASLITFTPSFD